MRESFQDDDPISEFPSEGDASIFPSEGSSAAPQSPAPVGSGLARDSAFCDVLTVPVVGYTPPRDRRDVRPRSAAVTMTAVQQWLVGIRASTRRGAALLPLIAQRLLILWRSLPAIPTNLAHRPAFSMPVVAFLSGLTAGALGMWMMSARMDGVVALAESNSVEAAPEPRGIASAGIGAAPRLTATSGSQSVHASPAIADTVARTATPTMPPIREEVTRRALEPAVRRPSPKPALAQRQDAALRPAAAAGTQYRGSLSVRSRPEGASVFVNGRLVGTTPLVLTDEIVGSRAVRVTLSGYDAWTAAARVVADRETVLSADLRSLRPR